jgi:hypothetical protein
MKKRSINYENVIIQYNQGKSTRELAISHSTGIHNIQRILREYGNIEKNPTKEEERIIKDLYSKNNSPLKISELLHLKGSRVYRFLRKENLLKNKRESKLKYHYNEHYFDNIDSTDKAYFLGLIYADGCNIGNGLVVALQERDKSILEKFIKYVEFKGDLRFIPTRCINQQNQFKISLIGKYLSDSLILRGCPSKKSLILRFPGYEIIPNSYMSHFIRGYFDGDGCVYQGKNNSSKGVNFVGTDHFISNLIIQLNNDCNLSLKLPKISNNHTAQVTWGALEDVKTLYNYLYKDKKDLFIERKWEKFNKILKII